MKHFEIAKIVARGRTTIIKYMMSLTKVQLLKELGRSKILRVRDKREIFWHTTALQQSEKSIKRELKLKVGVRRIQRVIQEAPQVAYIKRHSSTNLQSHHLESRSS